MDTDNRGGGFLNLMEWPVRRYPYRGRAQFVKSWEEEVSRQRDVAAKECFSDLSEWMLFTGVDQQTFTQDFLDPATPWTNISWCSFDKVNSLLLVRMPKSRQHESAARQFSKIFDKAVEPTGLESALRDLGSATQDGPSGKKEPDCSWLPIRLPRGRSDHWPSVVVEVSFSETSSKLMSDVRYWLGDSQGDVELVITIKINRKKPEFEIVTWEYDAAAALRRRRVQVVFISKTDNNISINGSPMIIGFDKLFLRQPSNNRERDLTLDAAKLEQFASRVWREQHL